VLATARGAQVNGCDRAEGLLTIARQRVPDGDFRVAALAHLPYPAGAFDAIIVPSAFAALADPLAALHELRRVCTANGRVVVAMWHGPHDGEQRAICARVQALLAVPTQAQQVGRAGHAPLEDVMGQAGLRIVGSAVVPCPCAYPDAETAWQALVSSATMQAALRAVGTARLKAAVFAAIAPYRTAVGGVLWENHFRHVTAVAGDDSVLSPSSAGTAEPAAEGGG
jgi:SAM-dependent methyltransferase